MLQRVLAAGSERSATAKRNIFLLFVFNGFNFLFNLLTVRYSLYYLGQEQYGIWVTLASVMTWFTYLDFGLGNGLRNKLAEAFAQNDLATAKKYVSTTYAVFCAALAAVLTVFLLAADRIDWNGIFNTTVASHHDLTSLIWYVFTFFTVSFLLKLISFVVLADQRPAVNGLFSVVINAGTVLLLIVLIRTTGPSLVLLGAYSSAIPVAVFAGASMWLFRSRYREIAPSLRAIDLGASKELIGLGFKFFIIQASSLIIFATDNLIITQLYGPDQVTIYNVAYRYFNYIPIIFFVILNPLWSAFTDASVRNDIAWMKNTVNKIIRVWGYLSIGVVLMVLVADTVYTVWLKDTVHVPLFLTILMGLFAIISNWNNIFAYFLNGVGKITLQLYSSIAVAIINIPLSIWFAKNLHFGIAGIMMGTLVCLLVGSVWAPMQYSKIIRGIDRGIWSK